MTRVQGALAQIRHVRKYTLSRLEPIPVGEWFRMPAEGVTHVAWQVGHLATAEYHLCMARIRGRRPDDEQFIPQAFVKSFGRGSVADPDPAKNPTVEEIRATLDRVHEHAMAELADYPDAEIDAATAPPAHPMFATKFGALIWCGQHEMLHVGQIGLLRRLAGAAPLW
jgi:hypothetical protein